MGVRFACCCGVTVVGCDFRFGWSGVMIVLARFLG